MVIFGTKFILENELKSYPEKVRKLRTCIAYQFSFDVSQPFRFGGNSNGYFWGCSFGSRFGSRKLGTVNENTRIETIFKVVNVRKVREVQEGATCFCDKKLLKFG